MAKKKQEQRQQEQRQQVTQLIGQAAQNGNLGRKEFERIIDAGGNANRVLERAVANKGLTINSGVVNQYNKGAYFSPNDYYKYSAFNQPVNPIINQIKSAGKLDPKSTLFIGSKGSTATVLPRGYGGPTAKPTAQAPVDTGLDTTDTGTGDYSGETGGDFGGDYGGDMGGDVGTPAADTTSQLDGNGLPGGGAGIDSAAGLKSKKSSRRQLGLSTKGTKQLNRSMMISNLNFA
jgi:hypothetical protein